MELTLFVILSICLYTALSASPTVQVSKFSLAENKGITATVSAIETIPAKTLLICVQMFHSRRDACFASYYNAACRIYTTGCCPTNVIVVTGSSLLRRNLTGLVRNNEDCSYHKNAGKPSGVYMIYPEVIPNGISVYCDMDTDQGGWTTIQQRRDGSVDFYRTWNEYKNGFGNISGDYWLGNENIYLLTRDNSYLLRIDFADKTGARRKALYYSFKIDNEPNNYKLAIGEYCEIPDGVVNIGDDGVYGMMSSNNAVFDTRDRGIVKSWGNQPCADQHNAGWWFKKCTNVNLNGMWSPGLSDSSPSGKLMFWYSFKYYEGLAMSSMKIRRK